VAMRREVSRSARRLRSSAVLPYHPRLMSELTFNSNLALTKPDLRCLLDGSLRLATLIELADAAGVALPADEPEALKRALKIGSIRDSLEDFLMAFEVSLSVLQTEEALYRAAYELGEDAARENVRYLEVRYAPVLHTRCGLALERVVEAVVSGLAAAERQFDLKAGVILCGIRNQSPATSLEAARLAVRFKGQGVIGFDLAGAEEDHPAK